MIDRFTINISLVIIGTNKLQHYAVSIINDGVLSEELQGWFPPSKLLLIKNDINATVIELCEKYIDLSSTWIKPRLLYIKQHKHSKKDNITIYIGEQIPFDSKLKNSAYWEPIQINVKHPAITQILKIIY